MIPNIVDSHVHVWADGHSFAAPDHGTAKVPVGDAGIDSISAVMAAEGISAAVLVQYIGYRWDNEYVARAILAHPTRFAGVCRIDPTDPDAPDRLSYWTDQRGFHGVRVSASPGPDGDWIDGPRADPLFARAASLGIPIVVLIQPQRLADLIRVLDRHPDVDVVIDHLADCDPEDPDHRRYLARLAANPRVFLKTGHIWAKSAQGFPWSDRHDLIRLVCDLFGTERLMWGSDWPFCLARANLTQIMDYILNEVKFLSPVDLGWIMSGTAKRLWTFSNALPAESAPGPSDRAVRVAIPDTAQGKP